MPSEPLISVVIPARNGAGFLSSAMESVAEQRYSNLEVLLVDDGSTDGLNERLSDHPTEIRYFRQEPQGPAAARNKGISESTGALIAFLDIDDLWTELHLKTLLRALQQHEEAGIAQGMMRQFWGAPEGRYRRTQPYRMPYLGTCLFRKSVFQQCGLFDVKLPYGEDHDFFFRCWENDVMKVNVPEVSLLYRRHANSLSCGRREAAQLLVAKRRIERIRTGVLNPAAPRKFSFQDYIGDRDQVSHLLSMEVSECALGSA